MRRHHKPSNTAASIFTARRQSGEQGPRLPDSCRPSSLEAAMAIQAAVTAQLGVLHARFAQR